MRSFSVARLRGSLNARRAAISLEFLHRFLVPRWLLGNHLIFPSPVFYETLKHDIISA